ncbi:MAG: hypothetical protein J3R72DRAFT_458939 [Linnemannia gamsii]|nr:MAG: hypothetical protein J3R72DRAFT_458939 [Linnemannia gamsii]
MIPLTRSRLNRYNAGVIDLSSSYRQSGRAEHPPANESQPLSTLHQHTQIGDNPPYQSHSYQDSTKKNRAPKTPRRKRKFSDEEMESVVKEERQRQQQQKRIKRRGIVSGSRSALGPKLISKASMAARTEDSEPLLVLLDTSVSTGFVAQTPALSLQSVLTEPISNSESNPTHVSSSAQTSPPVRAESDGRIKNTNILKKKRAGRSVIGTFIDEAMVKEYRKHRVHWKVWCERKRYDEDRVTREKFLLYSKEIMAQEAYEDEENPHLSIRPIYKKLGHDRIHPTMMKKRLAAMYRLHQEQCQQFGRQEPNLEDDVMSEAKLMIEEYTKVFIAGGGSLSRANSSKSQESGSKDVSRRDGTNNSTVEAISSSRELSLTRLSAISLDPATESSSSPKSSSKSSLPSPDSSSNATSESSDSSSQAASVSSDASSDVASASSNVSSDAASESSDPSSDDASTSSKSSSSTSSSAASSSSTKTSSTITSESIPISTPLAKTEFDGSVPAATLLPALLPQSTTISPSPEPISAPISASNSNSTSAPTRGPLRSVPFTTTLDPESTLFPPGPPFAPWTQEGAPSNTEKQASITREEAGSDSGGAQNHQNNARLVESRNPGTIRRHHSMQMTWNEWCIRKRYTDGNLVTPEKYLKYVAETTSREPFEDENNPHLSVRPLYRKTPATGEPVRVSKFTFTQYLTAIRFLHKEQCLKNGIPVSDDIMKGNKIRVLLHDYDMLLNNIPQTTKRVTADKTYQWGQTDGREVDPSDDLNADLSGAHSVASIEPKVIEQNDYRDEQSEQDEESEKEDQDSQVKQHKRLVQDERREQAEHGEKDIIGHKRNRKGSSIAPLRSSMRALWTTASNCPSLQAWKNAHQRRLRAAFDCFTEFEHDLSLVLPSHLHLVHVWSENDEALFTTGIAITKESRDSPSNEARYSIFLREKDIEICPVGALAFYLLAVFSGKSSAPDFHTKDWEFRSFLSIEESSRALDSVNVDDLSADTSMEGESNSTYSEANDTSFNCSPLHRLTPLFLPTAQRLGSYMLTATFSDSSAFYLPRSRVLPPAALQKQLFPFIEDFFEDNADWQTWIDNIMMDRPLDTSRPETQRTYYKAADFPAIRFMRVLARLRKVILQDFAVMMTCNGGDEGQRRLRDDYACLAHHPVFSTPEFLDFAAQLHEAIGADADFLHRSTSVMSGSMEDAVLDLHVQEEEEEESVSTSAVTIQERVTETDKDFSTSENAHQRLREIMELLSPSDELPDSMEEVPEADKQNDLDSGAMEVPVADNQNDFDSSVILREVGGREEARTVVEQEFEVVVEQEPVMAVEQESGMVVEQDLRTVVDQESVSVSVVKQKSSAASSKHTRRHRGRFSKLRSSAKDLPAIPIQDTSNDNNNPDVAQQDVALQVDTPQKPQTDHVVESLIEYEAIDSPDDNQGLGHEPQSADLPVSDAILEPVDIRGQKRSLLPRHSSKDLTQPSTNTVVQEYPVQKERRSSLEPLEAGLARVSINVSGLSQHMHTENNTEQLRQVIQTLSAKVAFLEQEKNNKQLANARPHSQHGLPTPETLSATPSRFSIDSTFQDKSHGSSNGFDQYRLQNQALRDKLAYLEQENKALAERSLQLRLQDELYDTCPNITTTATTPTSTSAAPYCSFESDSLVRVHGDDNGDMNYNDESSGLEQEIQRLRVQLAVKEQEKNATLDYTMASIESAEFLDGKMVQMEQSMHGLWTMVATSEAARFSVGPSSPAVIPQQQQQEYQQQQQQQQQQQDRHHRLRLRVDAMRRRIGSSALHRS